MVRGRTTSGAKLVDKIPGSETAKERLKALLETLGGKRTIVDACDELGISEAMFYKMRDQFLGGAVELMEPKKCGRKRKNREPEEVTDLKNEVDHLKKELLGANVREDLALLENAAEKKQQTQKPGPKQKRKAHRKRLRRKM